MYIGNYMKNNQYHIVGTVLTEKNPVELGNIDSLSTQIYDCSLSWFGMDISIKSG